MRGPVIPLSICQLPILGLLQLPLIIAGLLAFNSLQGLAELSTKHFPHAPQENESVRITAETTGPPHQKTLWLHYQLVDPGNYIALSDANYQTDWISVPMSDEGLFGDTSPHDGLFTVTLGPELQRHRRLVRYRCSKYRSPQFPLPKGISQNAYFVYNGVPDWQGAINPRSKNPKLAQAVSFSSKALTRVPVYHLISKQEFVEQATWRPRSRSFQSGGGKRYEHTGTFVYQGTVYDHIQFRARGGVWRHAMGKNMWKFNFRAKQPFQAHDHFGTPYESHWDKLNLGACIQQGNYGMRGEQGMFEALTYRLFNLAGTPAPATHWIHLRIIDHEEESPRDQYSGDFWGLYLAVENLDGSFFEQHKLPQGNLYKIENYRASARHLGSPFKQSNAAPAKFLQALARRRGIDDWWETNVDLGSYYRYRSILEAVHHYDIGHGKNYYYLYDPSQAKWLTIPWDVDLTWAESMYGSGHEPFIRAGVFRNEQRRHAYQSQLAEIRDLLFNESVMSTLIDDHARIIDPPEDNASLADADRALWDYHPVMNSRESMRHKADQGQFYFRNSEADLNIMTGYMKQFVRKRSQWMDRKLLQDYTPLSRPVIQRQKDKEGASAFQFSAALPSDRNEPVDHWQWRFALIKTQERDQPARYEIESPPIQGRHGNTLRIQKERWIPGKYRVRSRAVSPTGKMSRWSLPFECQI